MSAAATVVRAALREHIRIPDAVFDQLYPDHVRRLSAVHWTPIAAALRAAELLAPRCDARVLDIGAGAGKLCCVGAAAYAGSWHGIERDPDLVAVAVQTAHMLDVSPHASFRAGDALAVDWRGFTGIYLFNPFESQRFGGGFARVAGGAGHGEQIAATQARLTSLLPGTRVVTFHGFGGDMPPEFALAGLEHVEGGRLALWIKRSRAARIAQGR